MPVFLLHLRRRATVDPDEIGLECRDLHHAYMEACRAVPDLARDELIQRRDPMACAFLICDAGGRQLLEVPFAEVLSPAEFRAPRARRRVQSGTRSAQARDDLALNSFRRMFSSLDVGCVLMTPDLNIVEMNEFGARHSHVDQEAIRGTSILSTFDLAGKPAEDFSRFITLAQAGFVSEIIDMPYLVLDDTGATADGWWNARTWPIYDDDGRVLGLVEWAEPSINRTNAGRTVVRTKSGSFC